MSRLGVPYQGSKNFIAQQIVDFLPRAETFVDLFAGGCAVTHAAILSGKFSNFIANDLQVFTATKSKASSARKTCSTGRRQRMSLCSFQNTTSATTGLNVSRK